MRPPGRIGAIKRLRSDRIYTYAGPSRLHVLTEQLLPPPSGAELSADYVRANSARQSSGTAPGVVPAEQAYEGKNDADH